VARDVRNEKVSLSSARDHYGVVLNETTLEVDEQATRKIRDKMSRSKAKPKSS
jgi:hypothetical protein